MKRLARIALLGALLGFAGFWAAYAQSAPDLTSVDKIGWWTRRPGAQPIGPNAFEVAAGVQGEESVAALRILIRGTITKATLVMGEADAPLKSITPGKLRVCRTDSPWLVADAGAWAAAPKEQCDGAVELTRTEDPSGAGSWTGDITSMLTGARSEISLMVVPSPDKAAVLPPTYFIKLAARVDAEGTPDVQPQAKPVAAPASPPPSGGSAATPAPRTSTPSAAATAPLTSTPTTADPTENASTLPKRLTISSPHENKPWGKLVLLIPLALIASGLYIGSQKLLEQRLEKAIT